MGRQKQRGRPIDGVLVLDKPIGVTSNAALQTVKRLFNARKAGHTGSLDPLASGLLPICFGEATKFSQFLLDANKTYVVRAKLGVITDTSDADGQVIETRAVASFTDDDLEGVLSQFRGDIEQVPSMFSAIKHQGQPLYKLARQGIEVERQARPVTIFELRCEQRGADFLELFVRCSKGTYIRTLVEDIGASLACGAHVTMLRRLQAGAFQADQMVTMETLEAFESKRDWPGLNALLMAEDTMVSDYPEVELTQASLFYLQNGQAVQVPGAPSDGLVRLYGPGHQFYGVGEIDDHGKVAPKRLCQS